MFKKIPLIALIFIVTSTLYGCEEPDYKSLNSALTNRVGELSDENIGLIDRVKALEDQIENYSTEAERLEAERNALAIELKSLKGKKPTRRTRKR